MFFISSPVVAQTQPEDSVLFREGEILLSRGDTEKALWRFKRLLTEFPKSSLQNDAKYRIGVCYTQLKQPKEALKVLQELLSTFLSPSRMIQVLTLIGDNYGEMGESLNALHWYGKALLVPGQAKEDLKKKVRSIIDRFTKEEDLNRIESLYRGVYAGGYAKFRTAQFMKRQGNEAAAKRILTEWEREYLSAGGTAGRLAPDYGDEGKDLLDWYRAFFKPKYTIGVILPLSGIHQPFGERVLEAVQLALRPTEPEGKPPLASLVIRDSKGDPAEADRAMEELVAKEKVVAIIGPLLMATADRAARKAQQLKVPLLTLSQKEGLYGKGDFVFQNSLTPSEQIQALVAYAIKRLELKSFAIFYPNSPYGKYFGNLFSQEVSRGGGKVLGAVAYGDNQTDFGAEIKDFFKIKPEEKEEGQKDPRRFIAGVSVDGVFIPDVHDRAALVLSQIAYYDVAGVTFLGTNAINGPGLISIARQAAEGTVFVDAFFKNDSTPAVSRFVEEFKKAYQREPETLEALSYDGAKLLQEVLRTKEITSSIQLREQLLNTKNFKGVSGLKGFGEGGQTIRSLYILRVNRGRIEQVPP